MLKAICENWGTTGSHRFRVHFDENSGCNIQMPTASCELLAHPDRLDVRLSLENREDQERMEKDYTWHGRTMNKEQAAEALKELGW